ncbi:MAG: hypothetical protein EXR69_03615 [Myxococcales bacterium]|nr:hypothetical protein [Myxococcales bacterium]
MTQCRRFRGFVTLLALTLAAPACFESADDSGDSGGGTDSGDCVPSASALPEGVYGGAHYQLTVTGHGSAELRGDCSLATLDSAALSAGVADWILIWQSGYGLPVQDTGDIETIEVAFDGAYCGGRLTGTLTFPEGSTGELDVIIDAPAELYSCQ